MAGLDTVDVTDLQDWLDHVQGQESTRYLMLAIAHKRGVPVDDLADWYDVPAEDVSDWFDRLETEGLVTPIAEKEGIDVAALARQYGVSRKTVRDWLEELESESTEKVRELVARYSQHRSIPVFGRRESRVTYLNYDVVEANGWSVDDGDLFEKASRADLDPEDYGRILVDPGQSILEAAESRGFDWPYACRGGACANCAVLVTEGDIAMPGNNILSDEDVDVLNARLTCVGVPVTEEVKLVMNVQHLDQFEDLRLPSPVGASEWTLSGADD